MKQKKPISGQLLRNENRMNREADSCGTFEEFEAIRRTDFRGLKIFFLLRQIETFLLSVYRAFEFFSV